MKIENSSPNPLSRPQVQEAQSSEAARSARQADTKRADDRRDQLQLSDQAQMLAKAQAVLADQPEVRTEKVTEIKQAVEAGTYQVPHESLARRLMSQLRG